MSSHSVWKSSADMITIGIYTNSNTSADQYDLSSRFIVAKVVQAERRKKYLIHFRHLIFMRVVINMEVNSCAVGLFHLQFAVDVVEAAVLDETGTCLFEMERNPGI